MLRPVPPDSKGHNMTETQEEEWSWWSCWGWDGEGGFCRGTKVTIREGYAPGRGGREAAES